MQMSQAPDGIRFEGAHDGYAATFGLTHVRKIEMTFDGRGIAGEDMLIALNETQQGQFDKAMESRGLQGILYDIRFHLHPDVDAAVDLGGRAVSMALKSGEMWIFRIDGPMKLSLDVSVYLEKTRLKPRATKQVVLSGAAMEHASRIRWVPVKGAGHADQYPRSETGCTGTGGRRVDRDTFLQKPSAPSPPGRVTKPRIDDARGGDPTYVTGILSLQPRKSFEYRLNLTQSPPRGRASAMRGELRP